MEKHKVNLYITLGTLLALLLFAGNCARNMSEVSEEEPKAAEQPVLQIMAPYETPVNSRLLQELTEEYSEMDDNPSIELSFVSKNDFKKEICMSIEQNKLADLIICDNSAMPALVNLEVLQDISEYINGTHKVSAYSLAQWNNTMSDGKYYGIPFTCDPYVLIWNKDLFEMNEVQVPENWEELKAAVRKAQRVGVYGIGIGVRQSEEATSFFLQMLYSTGASIRDINGEGGMKVFEMISYLKDNKLLPVQCINWNQLDLTNKFMEGEVAMMINSLSALSVIKGEGVDFKVGVSPVPYEKKENYMFHGKNIGVSVTADYDESVRFLEYLTQKNIVDKVARTTESIPAQISVDYDFDADNFAVGSEFVLKQRTQGIAKSSLNSWFDISSAISDGIYQLLSRSDLSVREIADATHDKVRIAIIEN